MTPYARRKSVGGDVRHPLGIFDEVIQLWSMQRLGEGQKACGVVRGIISEAPRHGHVPRAMLDDLHEGPVGKIWRWANER
jgi:hypothetical protein